MARHVFTIVTAIAKGGRPGLERVLAGIQNGLDANNVIVFRRFPEVHFASFIIFNNRLVFENSVSGSRDEYLQALAANAGLDEIYQYCEDYPPQPKTQQRLDYLRKYYRRPNLRHVSTPYRTATSIKEDEEMVRRQLEPLALLRPSALPDPRAQVPAIRDSWNWEIVKPYVSIAGFLALLLGIAYVWALVHRPWLRWDNAVLAADIGLPLVLGGLFLLKMWRTTPRPFRVRAFTAMTRAVAVAVSLGLTWYAGTAHWIGALVLLAIAAAMSLSLVSTVAGWKREQVAALRQAVSAVQAVDRWNDLQNEHAKRSTRPYDPERGSWSEHLWNWRYWVLFPALTTALVAASQRYQFYDRLQWGLLVAFAVEAWWLTILVGWPPYSIWSRTRASFIFAAIAAAWFVLESLRILTLQYPFIYAILLLGAGLGLQAVTLPAPDVDVAPPNNDEQDTIHEVMKQEDHGVQNHMALAASVGTSFVRTISLRIFLWTLDRIFYRALLPDVWRGKLFGIPTVHSAQWVLLDDGRFLFLSNYDHSFTTYLNDFGTQIPAGIQKIWGTCAGNPGMQDVERFKLFVRKAMVPHQVWYRAYEDVSLRQIWNNEQIRGNLAFDDGDEMQMLATLRRFGGAPKLVPGITHAAAQ